MEHNHDICKLLNIIVPCVGLMAIAFLAFVILTGLNKVELI